MSYYRKTKSMYLPSTLKKNGKIIRLNGKIQSLEEYQKDILAENKFLEDRNNEYVLQISNLRIGQSIVCDHNNRLKSFILCLEMKEQLVELFPRVIAVIIYDYLVYVVRYSEGDYTRIMENLCLE